MQNCNASISIILTKIDALARFMPRDTNQQKCFPTMRSICVLSGEQITPKDAAGILHSGYEEKPPVIIDGAKWWKAYS